MDTSQDQQDDLIANLRKVTLNINSIHLKKKSQGKCLASKYNGKRYGGLSKTLNKQELLLRC